VRKHRIALLLLSVMLLVSVVFYPQTVSAAAFSDVSNHWARERIEDAVQEGWISGYGDGSFRPERHVTRAEFIKMVAAAAGLERKIPEDIGFPDAQGHWVYTQGWLGAALERGLLDAPLYKGLGCLEPDKPITRWEATVLAVRIAGNPEAQVQDLPFDDADSIPREALPFVSYAVKIGVISGFPDNTFRPHERLTRAQAVVIILRVRNARPLLAVHFLDVGQADSILIQASSGVNVLIDGGNNADGPGIVSYLKSQGVSQLNAVIATHPHEDHIGGLDTVIKEFPVDQVYMPKAVTTTKTFEDFLTAVSDSEAKVIQAKAGVVLDVPGLDGVFLAPVGDYYEDLNNYSAVLKFTFNNVSFLFMGDAESLSESEMLQAGYDVKADVLKVGHHGSNSSTSTEFLTRVSPKYAVISVGANNDFGHPSASVLSRLSDAGVQVYRTDRDGTVVMRCDGETVTITKGPSIETRDANSGSRQTGAVSTTDQVRIVSVDLAGETVTIRNEGDFPVDISGWCLVSVKGNQTYIFPEGTVLAPGEEVRVVSGPNARSRDGKLVWTSTYIWNNGGDPAHLYDLNGRKVSEK